MPLDITQWCGENTGHYDLSQPFVVGGWKYATDGCALIRVPTDEPDTPESRKVPRRAGEMIEDIPRESKWPKAKYESSYGECPDCEDGIVGAVQCSECDGEGEIHCDHCGHDATCENCDGHGRTGRKCKRCNGGGYCDCPSRIILHGEFSVAVKYDLLVRQLPHRRYAIHGHTCQIAFDGGEAVVMLLVVG